MFSRVFSRKFRDEIKENNLFSLQTRIVLYVFLLKRILISKYKSE